jgi:hypothetical protein
MAIDLDGAVALVTGGANGISAVVTTGAPHPARSCRCGTRPRAG